MMGAAGLREATGAAVLSANYIAARLGVSVSSVKKYMAKATEHCLLFSLENDVYS